MQIPTAEQFWNDRGRDRSKPDVAFLKNHFYREGRLSEDQAMWIITRATEILRKEENVLNVDAPITGTSPSSRHSNSLADCIIL
jgi:serine/threonine-protein phosphatase 2B catalytic subunit